MPVKHGANDPGNFKVGTSQVSKLYQGSDLVWSIVDLLDQSVSSSGVTPASAAVRVNVTSGGLQQSKSGALGYSTDNTWLNGGAASDYEVRATIASSSGPGGMSGDSLGVWLNCGTTREWIATGTVDGFGGIYEVDLTIEIRLAAGAVIASCDAFMSSERF